MKLSDIFSKSKKVYVSFLENLVHGKFIAYDCYKQRENFENIDF